MNFKALAEDMMLALANAKPGGSSSTVMQFLETAWVAGYDQAVREQST